MPVQSNWDRLPGVVARPGVIRKVFTGKNSMWVLKKSVIGTCFLAGSVAGDKFSFLTSAKR